MHRRMLLLFTLFVVTAWFYSSLTHNATGNVFEANYQQAKMLDEAEKTLAGGSKNHSRKEQG